MPIRNGHSAAAVLCNCFGLQPHAPDEFKTMSPTHASGQKAKPETIASTPGAGRALSEHHSGFSRRCVVAMIYFCARASIAASTFGGDIGSSVSRRPVARSIALAMAAIGGQILTSAAPLAPYG